MAPLPPISFNCVICFEEFNEENRHPVVLPCGHTYVCVACAGRLDKCMECRATLFASVPNIPAHSAPAPGRERRASMPGSTVSSSGRVRQVSVRGSSSDDFFGGLTGISRTSHCMRPPASYDNANSNLQNTRVQPMAVPEKMRLPLPKNIVLLSLMDAQSMKVSQVVGKSTSKQDDEVEDANKDCGTYAVVAPNELTIDPVPKKEIFPKKKTFPTCKIADSASHGSEEEAGTLLQATSMTNARSEEHPTLQNIFNSIEEDASTIIEDYKESAGQDWSTTQSASTRSIDTQNSSSTAASGEALKISSLSSSPPRRSFGGLRRHINKSKLGKMSAHTALTMRRQSM